MEDFIDNFIKFSNSDVIKDYIAMKENDKMPNFWRIIEYGKNSYETRYARMLRWLMDTTETHNQGSFFVNNLHESLQKIECGNAECEALGANIDIFFVDEKSKTTITIELKMGSVDHESDKEHQLDKYYNRVEELYNKKTGYTNHYFYITINGDKPTITEIEHIEEWNFISYSQILEIVKQMLDQNENKTYDEWKMSSRKIISDFYDDMTRVELEYSIKKDSEVFEFIKNNIRKDKNNLNRVNKLINYHENNIEMTKKDLEECELILSKIKEDSQLDDAKIKMIIEFIGQCITEQNHKLHEGVQSFMKSIFLEYTDCSEKKFDELKSTNRKGKIKKQGIPFSHIWMTQGKGQGLRFYVEDISNLDNSDRYQKSHIYFSGDSKGEIFNDGFSYFLPREKHKKPDAKITPSKLKKLYDSSEDNNMFFVENIEKSKTKFDRFLFELLNSTLNFEEIIELNSNGKKAENNKYTKEISLCNRKKNEEQ